ncbi:nuclear transport factor 2 family protein [Luminiphilus sp.]|jgi:hypothetical protein|nr:nuclear transport factor 2 family protein [bacterium]MDB2643063.1 nuclear transport factor 2 family protein [Luminiphilus sp.]MDB4049470.1 nuclear transport factor 2 family protein [Luminiphilus sp.]
MQQLTLQTLSDRALISDQLYRYAKGLDTRDWGLIASVLTDPFHLQAEMLDIDCTLSPQEYIELAPAKFLPGFDATTHLNTNQLITIDGHQAHIETRMYACHYINPQDNTLTDHLSAPASTHCNMQMHWEGWLNRQPDGSWLFHKFYMGVVASEGDMSAMQTARSRVEN